MSEIAELRQRVHEHPANGWLQLCLGAKLLEEGRLDESGESLQEARRLEPATEGEASYLLGRLALARGLLRSARFELCRALRNLPSDCDLRDEVQHTLQGAQPQSTVSQHPFPQVVGRSRALSSVLRRLGSLVRGDRPLVLVGEPGTGRGLLAEEIRRYGPQAYRSALHVLDCGALSPGACERKLFGVARFSRSGPSQATPGLLEQAEGATVLIEAVDLLTPAAQRRLLCFLRQRALSRAGGRRSHSARVRLVLTVEDELHVLCEQGRLISGLEQALRGAAFRIPPLRERRLDILHLVDHFWSGTELEPKVLAALVAQPWPGNVAQLREVLRWLAGEQRVTPEMVERFHERTVPLGLEPLEEPVVVDPSVVSWVSPELARAHRICPLRQEHGRLVVAIDRARPRLELRGLRAILGTRVRWVRVTAAQLEPLLERAYPPLRSLPLRDTQGEAFAQGDLLELLDGCLARDEFPDPERLTRLVVTKLCESTAAHAVVLYGVSGQGLGAEGLAFSADLVCRRPELASLHGRACPALNLAPGAGLAGRVSALSGGSVVAAASAVPGPGAEPALLRALGLEARSLQAVRVDAGGKARAVIVVVNPCADQPDRNFTDLNRHLTDVVGRLAELLSPGAFEPREVARRLAVRLAAAQTHAQKESPVAPQPAVELIGWSRPMTRLRAQLRERARDTEPVLVVGEAGTGKEWIARTLQGMRPGPGRFRVHDCTASVELPPLIGGTLLLDAVEALSTKAQHYLLGRMRAATSPARLIAATSCDLAVEAASGRFSSELFALLTRRQVLLAPPLRERLEDVPLLTEYFLAREARHTGKPLRTLAPGDRRAIVERLTTYGWPGNVRELQEWVRLATLVCRGQEIRLVDLPRPEDGAVQQVFKLMERIEATQVPVLISGGTGIDRELVARVLHGRSPRAGQPFVRVDCASLSDAGLEQDLFGAKGLFRRAQGGTLFLEGVEQMTPTLQRVLLQVKQGVVPLERGGRAWIDVRVISATGSGDLRERVRRREFRQDLFSRLNVVALQLPPLSRPSPAVVERAMAQGVWLPQPEQSVPRVFAETYQVCPILIVDDVLVVASSGGSASAGDDLRFMLNRRIELVTCDPRRVSAALQQAYAAPERSLPACPPPQVLTALPAAPALRAIPAAAAPLPRPEALPRLVVPLPAEAGYEELLAAPVAARRRAWFTREGWSALATGLIVYSTVIGVAIHYWDGWPWL